MLVDKWRATGALLPGVLVCVVVALAANFLSAQLGGAKLLYALFFGLAMNFLMELPRMKAGIAFTSRTVLRVGVALLGARITLDQVMHLGWRTALMLVLATAATIGFGVVVARWMGRRRDEGLLSGCSVGICGASAALAVASVLPQTKENERFTLVVVIGVTLLSTIAMVLYPLGLQWLEVAAVPSGVFLGGSIHDVAQVVAAGSIMGRDVADVAVIAKLFRVMLLVPVVLLIIALGRRARQAAQASGNSEALPPLIPGFLVAFLVLVGVNSLGWLPTVAVAQLSDWSGQMLVLAMAAIGIKTNFGDLMQVGLGPVMLLLGETLFLAGVLAMLLMMA